MAQLLVDSDLAGEPPKGVSPRSEGVDGISSHFCRNERLKGGVKLGFGIAQFSVREPTKGHITRASRKYADPRIACRALPKRAVVLAVWVCVLARANKASVDSAVIAGWLRQRLDRAADAHEI